MKDQILHQLEAVEQSHAVRIVYAAEAGSRAWGIASPDSDFDVRFIYVCSSRDYLRLESARDVIELPIEDSLDINGWDLYKALRLFRSSNPPLLEWLYSPIIYLERGTFASQLRALAVEGYSTRRMTYHYLSMVKRTYREFLEGRDAVSLKKMLYALRPLVSVAWVEQHGTPPPTALEATLDSVELEHGIREKLSQLIQTKRSTIEMGVGEPDAQLTAYMLAEMDRIGALVRELPDPTMDVDALNRIAWQELGV